MPKLEFGSFYRFLTSAGIVLVVLGLGLPWLTAQLLPVLEVTSAELLSLTPTARSAIRTMQDLVAEVVAIQKWVVLSIVGAGGILLLIGLASWFSRQRVADKLENATKLKTELEVHHMSEGQRRSLQTTEAMKLMESIRISQSRGIGGPGETKPREVASQPDEPAASESDATRGELGRQSPPHGGEQKDAREKADVVDELRAQISRIEKRTASLLVKGFGDRFTYAPSVLIRDTPVDLIAMPKSAVDPALLFEVKVSNSLAYAKSQARLVIEQLAYIKGGNLGRTWPNMIGIGIMVITEQGVNQGLANGEEGAVIEASSTSRVLVLSFSEGYILQATPEDLSLHLNHHIVASST